MNFQRSRDSYFMGTNKGIYGDEIDFLRTGQVQNNFDCTSNIIYDFRLNT